MDYLPSSETLKNIITSPVRLMERVGEAIADGVRCELLSIDGGHSYHSAFVDLVNARWLAAPEQHDALIDDTNANTSVSREVALDR